MLAATRKGTSRSSGGELDTATVLREFLERESNMASAKQIAANRANAQKSTGPRSSAGKEKSSRNSIRHGLTARAVLLAGESRERFDALLDTLEAELKPAPGVESLLVETMAIARWRQWRIWQLETASINHEMRKQDEQPDFHDGHDSIATEDQATRAAIAFRTLADKSKSLDVMNRCEARYCRQYDQAFSRLMAFRENNDFSKRSQSGSAFST